MKVVADSSFLCLNVPEDLGFLYIQEFHVYKPKRFAPVAA